MTGTILQKQRIFPQLLPLLLLTALAFAAGRGASLAAVLSQRVTFCLQTLIPSLFGCMVLANLLIESGAADFIGRNARLTARILHLSPALTGIFWVSQLAGYPVGTLLLRRQQEKGLLSPADASRLACVCFGGGPAFAVGFAGAGMFGSAAAGWLMLSACIAANLITAAVLCRKMHPKEPSAPSAVRLRADAVTSAVSDAEKSLAAVCGTVLLFGMLSWLAESAGFLRLTETLCGFAGIRPPFCDALTSALSDLTQLAALTGCGLPLHILLPLTAGLLSFGGICVHLQCLALSGGILSARRLILVRLLTALLAALLTAPAVPFLHFPDAAAVFSPRISLSESGSVIPGLLIFCTGFPFLIKKD